jgi:hypothetical protein
MVALPRATTTVEATAAAPGGGVDLICVIAPVPTNADITPRLFGSAEAIYDQHGYSEGVEYVSVHVQRTRRSVLFVGVPIDSPGVIGREDTSGNTDTCVTTITEGSDGVLAEHDGVLTVISGGTIGTDQIMLGLSLDGGRKTKRVRLGTASSYTIPYFGATIAFGAGDLTTGETIHTWHGSAPTSVSSDWALARAALASQMKFFRSVLLVGDLSTDTEADAFNTQLEAYETSNERFVYGRASIADRLPQAALSQLQVRKTGSSTITFATAGDTATRSAGSWIADGFAVGDSVTFDGSTSNDVTAIITTLTALVMTCAATNFVDEGPVADMVVVGCPTLTFAEIGASADTLTRSRGSWLSDGFRVGDVVSFDGTSLNEAKGGTLTTVTATVLTFGATPSDLEAEVIGAFGVSVTAGQSKAVWMAASDAEFASVDDAFRIDLSAGRGRILSPFTDWLMRRPAGWFASWREYAHDLHVAPWRKEDGPVGADLYDAEDTLVEWDDRVDGEAASAARFTSLRTWANGPQGAFIAGSLTRATEGSILGQTHNVAVTNLACSTVQAATEAVIGRGLVLNDDGTATTASLSTISAGVNAALERELLRDKRGEGQRASKAVWTPSTDDILNVAEATITGVLELNLLGTIHSMITRVRVLSGGQ